MRGSRHKRSYLSRFDDGLDLDLNGSSQFRFRFDDRCYETASCCSKSNNNNSSSSSKRRRRPERREGGTKGILTISTTIVVMIHVLLATTIIETSFAFVVISPTKIMTPNGNPNDDSETQRNYYLQTPSSSLSSQQSTSNRIRYRTRQTVFRAAAAAGENNINPNNNNNNNSNSNSGKKPNPKNNKKAGKGNPTSPKQTKKSSKFESTKNTKTKKKPKPLDPSKQKKKEILEQIKAKIKEEGEEKKRKQQNYKDGNNHKSNIISNNKDNNRKGKNNKPKKNQKQPQTPTSSSSTAPKPSQPTQTRFQKLADEDPSESQFDETENENKNDPGDNNRKKLFMNPFEAGKTFRETLQNLSTLGRGLQLPKETKQKYFVDDRLLDGDDDDPVSSSSNNNAFFSISSSPLLQSNFNSKSANSLLQEYARAEALDPIEYIPEVLVVGATGEIGRLVVRRLLLEGRGRFRIRVLVRDLYSQTLNLLGTGVSYCQGDLNDVESLEYSLTDVDKIVYVAGAPKPDETDFQRKFQLYLEEHDLKLSSSSSNNNNPNQQLNDLEWEQLTSVMEVRSELAEQVDCIGMKNLVTAYQNVRHTDYGTSQAAKRSLFKFKKNSPDFDLFSLDDGDEDEDDDKDGNDNSDDDDDGDRNENKKPSYRNEEYGKDQYNDNDDYEYDGEYDESKYEDVYNDDDMENYGLELEARESKDTNVVKSQVKWLCNKYHRGVFVGRVPKADAANPSANPGGEASIIISRLRAREDPEHGIDMSGFSGFILRMVSDGNSYEAFVRTELYETDGIEYVYQFPTESKVPRADNYSDKRFKTIRLAFKNFKPVQRRKSKKEEENDGTTVPPFVGSDVRYLGFRFRASSNISYRTKMQEKLDRFSKQRNDRNKDYQQFYMALTYIKVYRAQPEPEFIYLSDARIPPVIRNGMVHHERKMLLTDEASVKKQGSDGVGGDAATLLDEKDLERKSMLERSPEETYFKYRGEEILIKSGLSYTIIRVAGFNELSGSEASTIDLVQSNSETNIVPVSRAEVAQVCVSALLDPCALNKCVYMTKKSVAGKNVLDEEDISAKFEGIPTDVIL